MLACHSPAPTQAPTTGSPVPVHLQHSSGCARVGMRPPRCRTRTSARQGRVTVCCMRSRTRQGPLKRDPSLYARRHSQSDVVALKAYSLEVVLRNLVGYLRSKVSTDVSDEGRWPWVVSHTVVAHAPEARSHRASAETQRAFCLFVSPRQSVQRLVAPAVRYWALVG